MTTRISLQVQMGWGYWRVLTRYVSDDSLDQEDHPAADR